MKIDAFDRKKIFSIADYSQLKIFWIDNKLLNQMLL